MGRNAQTRRALKVVHRHPDTARPRAGQTKTMQRLRQAAAQITTLQQFEECIARAHPDNQGPIRKLLATMIKPGLPCCGAALLAAKVGRTEFAHGAHCPSRNLVVLS
jgi:hypothetical protein